MVAKGCACAVNGMYEEGEKAQLDDYKCLPYHQATTQLKTVYGLGVATTTLAQYSVHISNFDFGIASSF